MNVYPDQLKVIGIYLKHLDAAEAEIQAADIERHMGAQLRDVVVTDDDGTSVLGRLVDEIGGAWSFELGGEK